MSKPALQYYQERANRLGIDTVPQILNGRPRILWQDSYYPDISEQIQSRYEQVLSPVREFSLQCAGKQECLPAFRHQEGMRQNRQHAERMIASLVLPPHSTRGTLAAIYIEAVPGSALRDWGARHALALSPWRMAPEYEDETAYLQVNALYRRAAILAVRQAHVLTYPHEFYEPAIATHAQVVYRPFDISSSTSITPTYHLARVNALPWAAE